MVQDNECETTEVTNVGYALRIMLLAKLKPNDLSPESGDNMVKAFLECLFHVRMIVRRADCTFFVHCGK